MLLLLLQLLPRALCHSPSEKYLTNVAFVSGYHHAESVYEGFLGKSDLEGDLLHLGTWVVHEA